MTGPGAVCQPLTVADASSVNVSPAPGFHVDTIKFFRVDVSLAKVQYTSKAELVNELIHQPDTWPVAPGNTADLTLYEFPDESWMSSHYMSEAPTPQNTTIKSPADALSVDDVIVPRPYMVALASSTNVMASDGEGEMLGDSDGDSLGDSDALGLIDGDSDALGLIDGDSDGDSDDTSSLN